MFNYIIGNLIEVSGNHIVVENSGIGFEFAFPVSNTINLPSIGEKIKVYTYMNVREDEISLYGFLTNEDKEMFLMLLTVNGVGPKGALNIISTFGFTDLINAISNDDNKLIASVQGIGQKTASKICIELGDKVRKLRFGSKTDIIKQNNEKNRILEGVRLEAVEALVALGYKENKARELVARIAIDENIETQEIIKQVLKG